jgi:uncharacterized protein
MPGLQHPADHSALTMNESDMISGVYDFTEEFFRNPKFDASHDFNHVRRVVHNAATLLQEEKRDQPDLDTFLVLLGALLHDIEDRKYTTSSSVSPISQILHDFDIDQRVDPSVVKQLVDGVSYSSEIKNPQHVEALIKQIPELAIVQDADRLDAIGAIGIGRCFTFGGANSARNLDDSIQHFEEKLLRLEGMMKTQTGKKMAAERSRRIREFMNWWRDEQIS